MTSKSKSNTLAARLRAMFSALRDRPMPDAIRAVVDQLDEATSETPQGKRRSDR